MPKIFKSIVLSLVLVLVVAATSLAAESVYIVQAGDTLSAIATKNGVSVDYLKQLNGLKSDALYIGDRLVITPESSIVAVNSSQTESTAGTYLVQAGDTLWGISQRCGLSVNQLKQLNNLSSDFLYIGQTLSIGSATMASYSGTADSSGESAAGDRVVKAAAQYLGTPYVYGGQSPSGFDCSGFTSYIYKEFGYSIPRTAASQAQAGTAVSKSDLSPGDLVFFNCSGSSISHVGIYCGDDEFIHSSCPRDGGVIYSSLDQAYYASRYVCARRIL